MINTKTKLQQITDEAWIVQKGDERIGILNKDIQNHYTFITGKHIEMFVDDKEVASHFGNITLFEEQIEIPLTQKDGFYIKGHLVDYTDPIPVEQSDANYNHDIPLYLKTEGSDVYYAAGWYCINFAKGWKQGHGPKLTTLLEYGSEGPFKTQLECKARMRKLNKERKARLLNE